MLAKLAASAFLATGMLCSTVFAQQNGFPSNYSNQVPSAPVAYSFQQGQQQESLSTDELEEIVKRLGVRLSELEIDVENKLKSQPEAEAKAASADKALSERVDELEKGAESTDKAVSKLEDTLPGLMYHGHKSPKLQFFGRIHVDYWAFPGVEPTIYPLEATTANPTGNPQDRFNFRRMRIGVKGDLNDNTFYKWEGEFAGGAATSYRDAFLGFKELPILKTVIIGNHKRPYGLDHLNSSRHNVFIERPFIVEAFNQDSRRMGVSSNGVSEDQCWNWRLGVWNQELTQTRSGYIGDHYQMELAGRLARTAWYDESSGGRGYAHFALSGSVGFPDGSAGSTNNQARYRTRPESRTTNRWLDTGAISGADEFYLVGFETAINVGAWNFTGEYMRNNVDREDAVGEDVAFDGYYYQVSYFLTGEHRTWNRKTGCLDRVKPFENFFCVRDCDCNVQRGWGAWELAFRYSHADLNNFDILGGEAESYTLAMNWYWNPYARMQFNWITGEIESGAGAAGQGDYDVLGMRLMVDF